MQIHRWKKDFTQIVNKSATYVRIERIWNEDITYIWRLTKNPAFYLDETNEWKVFMLKIYFLFC